MKIIRQLIPLLLVPLSLVASVLSAAPWLRSFPVSVGGVSLYGAAILSVLIPFVAVALAPGRLWIGIAADVFGFAVYTLFVVLQDPGNVSGLASGLYRGPSQLLTFALPLVSPRTLLVAPVALCWLAGSLAGECLARRWYSLLPYVGFLVAFGLAYAGTQRSIGSAVDSARLRETLLAGGLLITLLLMRVAQAWVRQDQMAETTQPDGILPLRGLAVGTVTTVVVAVAAALVVQTAAFPKRSDSPQRVPSIDNANPLTPLSFISGIRPRNSKATVAPVFTVSIDKASPGYFAIANLDSYDGSGWSFTRTFRPSGGVLPPDTDSQLRTTRTVTQQYRVAAGPLTDAPWMPFMYRPQRVTGTSVNIDPGSGMIVPASHLESGQTYTVKSDIGNRTFAALKAALASPDTSTPTTDVQLPPGLGSNIARVIRAFSEETGTPSSPALPFLKAFQKDLETNYALSAAAQGSATSTAAASPTTSALPTATPPSSPASSPATSPKTSPKPGTHSSTHVKHAKHPEHHTHAIGVHRLGATGPQPAVKRPKHPRHKHPSKDATTHPATGAPSTAALSSPSPSDSGPAADLAGGTGYSDVLASILGPDRSGTPEQFATLVALVARGLGVPARVVTGFRVQNKDGSNLQPGNYDVTTADAWTWTEIPVVGQGWIVLDASPGTFTNGEQQTESAGSPPKSSSAPPTKGALLTQSNRGHAVAKKSPVPATASAPRSALLVAVAIALLIVVLGLALVLLSRKPRRAARRRRSPDPRTRVIGAWQESIDVLTEAGLPELSARTSSEIAGLAGEQFGPDAGLATESLGTVATAVAYSTTTVVGPEDADAAWAAERALRKQVRRQLGVRDRIAATWRVHRAGGTGRPSSPPSWAESGAARVRGERDRSRRRSRTYQGRRRAH